MKRFFPMIACAILCFAAVAAAQTAGIEVRGFYRVGQVTDLGKEVRVTLHIRLVNNSPQELSILRVGIRGAAGSAQGAETSAWARLEQREGTTMDKEFVVSKAEYARWRRGGQPVLQVAIQPEGGGELRRTIALKPSRERRPQ